jgi:hypothetical protein
MTASRTEFLAIYLNDHLAGSVGAIEMARRAAREHAGTELGAFFSRLAGEIEADHQALRRVMAAAGARPQHAKLALAWLGEKAGRLKLNGRVLRRSPLSPFVELEALEVGIYGKQLLLAGPARATSSGSGRRRPRRADCPRRAPARRRRAPPARRRGSAEPAVLDLSGGYVARPRAYRRSASFSRPDRERRGPGEPIDDESSRVFGNLTMHGDRDHLAFE